MKTLQSLFCLAFALGLTTSVVAEWLSPEHTADAPYQIAVGAFTFPNAEWSVFNATKAVEDALKANPVTYTVDAAGMLDFTTGTALNDKPNAYMALGISQGADDTTKTSVVMKPAVGSDFRTDNVYAKVTFISSETLPSVDDLKEMYPAAADRTTKDPLAVKLGVFVNSNGYFCFVRATSGTKNADGTSGTIGDGKDVLFDYCQTDIPYSGGVVTVRIEFKTYSDNYGTARAFRLWVTQPQTDADGAIVTDPATGNVVYTAEQCLTTGKGYKWEITEDKYVFDFSSLEEGDWLPLFDSAYVAYKVATDPHNAYIETSFLDSLNYLAFSATGGGFHAAWMTADNYNTLAQLAETYQLANFASFESSYTTLYEDWVSRYGVNLQDYLEPTNGLTTASEDHTLSEYAYNAFLLNMDPAKTVEQHLNVTGLVFNDDETISMTVSGPEGCDLSLLEAAKLCVRRAATIDGVATATPELYTMLPDRQNMTIVIPKVNASAEELPFMQVTLVALPELAE